MIDDTELRIEALRRAQDSGDTDPDSTIQRAEVYYRFLTSTGAGKAANDNADPNDYGPDKRTPPSELPVGFS